MQTTCFRYFTIFAFAFLTIALVEPNGYAQDTEAVAPIAVAPSEMTTTCPTQVRPIIPAEALAGLVSGQVIAQASVEHGAIKDVAIISGPPVYYEAIRTAMRQYKCVDAPNEIGVQQEFNFRFDERLVTSCPHQVVPQMPRKALENGIQGVVLARAFIEDGEVKRVEILSGPSVYHNPVREAMLKYKCIKSSTQIVANQEFTFSFYGSSPTFEYSMSITANDAGWNDRDWSELPLNKTYNQLNEKQQGQLRSFNLILSAKDEPPYPLAGVGDLHKYILQAAEKLGVSGSLTLRLKVNSVGKVTSAQVGDAPSSDLAKFAASVAMLTPFKPAVCSGQPCDMDFLFTSIITRKMH